MLAASLGLAYEGALRGPLGGGRGRGRLAFIVLVRRFLSSDEHPAVFAGMGGLDARKGLLIVGVMTAHSFTEGVGLGVSFGGGADLGLFITLAIAVHNIPEGLAISLVLVPRGVGVGRAAFWSVFSSLPQPLMALPAFSSSRCSGRYCPTDWVRGGGNGGMVFAEFARRCRGGSGPPRRRGSRALHPRFAGVPGPREVTTNLSRDLACGPRRRLRAGNGRPESATARERGCARWPWRGRARRRSP